MGDSPNSDGKGRGKDGKSGTGIYFSKTNFKNVPVFAALDFRQHLTFVFEEF